LWTRKEAYLKGLGTGLGRDLALDYLGTAAPELRPPDWHVADLPMPPGHAAAFAVRAGSGEGSVRQLPHAFVG
jgi:4'-phosphopantetheinyl transferase